jgi:hypothetical protein
VQLDDVLSELSADQSFSLKKELLVGVVSTSADQLRAMEKFTM